MCIKGPANQFQLLLADTAARGPLAGAQLVQQAVGQMVEGQHPVLWLTHGQRGEQDHLELTRIAWPVIAAQ
ncbi:hypothetical protein D3C84_1207460 [compost metagenome]